MVRLVLFDIDGTLIRSGGAGMRAFEATFAEIFDLPEATRGVRFCGRTDVSLVRECLTRSGVEPSRENFRRFFAAYPQYLDRYLKELPGAVCEGVHDFIDTLQSIDDPPVLGLLTGNVRRGAELKLTHYQLWRHFVTGAYADDHEERNGIAAAAKARGEAHRGKPLAGEEILVIGDTPHDIACGHSIQAKVLAVATGNFQTAELRTHAPRWAADHLGQIPALEVLGRQAPAPLLEK